MRDVKGSDLTSLSMLNYPDIYCVNSFYVDPNYVDNCIDPYYVAGEPPEDAAPLHHRLSPPQPLEQLQL